MQQLTLSQTIEGFLPEKQAQHLSRTLWLIIPTRSESSKLTWWLTCRSPVAPPTRSRASWATSPPRAPNGAAKRPVKGLSNKTILNIHTARAALWTWAMAEGIVSQHLLRQLPRPKPEERAITPFSEAEIKALLPEGEPGHPPRRHQQQAHPGAGPGHALRGAERCRSRRARRRRGGAI